MSFYFRVLSTAHIPGARAQKRHKSSILMAKSVKSKLSRDQASALRATEGSRRSTAPCHSAFKEKSAVFPAQHFHHRQCVSLQLTWAKKCSQRLGRRIHLSFECLQLRVSEESCTLFFPPQQTLA